MQSEGGKSLGYMRHGATLLIITTALLIIITTPSPLHSRRPGLFREACSAQVTGVPGAKFKGFASLDEALQFLKDTDEAPPSVARTKRKRRESSGDNEEEGRGLSTGSSSPPARENKQSFPVVVHEKKKTCVMRIHRNTTVVEFFEKSLRSQKWVSKNWIVEHWK